jgi:hypothetical protein
MPSTIDQLKRAHPGAVIVLSPANVTIWTIPGPGAWTPVQVGTKRR